MNLIDYFKTAMLALALLLLVACGDRAAKIPLTQQQALTNIVAYVQNEGDAPILNTYKVAHISGVTAENLDEVNELIHSLGANGAHLQNAITACNAAIEVFRNYANTTGRAPTLSDYQAIGVTGVTNDTIDAINALIAANSAEAVDSRIEVQGIVNNYRSPMTTYTLTYTADTHGSITGVSIQTVNQGEDASAVTAVADSGYHFTSWSDGSVQNPRTDSNVQSDIGVSAEFEMNYGLGGSHPIAYHDEVDANMTTAYYPTDIPDGTKVPVVFFASGYGSSDAKDYESLLRFIASHGYYVIYAKHAWGNVFANMDKMLELNNDIIDKIDTTRIGVLGHSLGGGYAFSILKHFSDMGYGQNGRFIMVLEGYYAYNLTKLEMQNLPFNTNVVMQQYGVGGNNTVNNTDPRITLTEYYLLDSIPANQKDWQIVEDADHHYPYGSNVYSQMQGILKPLDALMEYTFRGTQEAHDIALEQGNDNPYNYGDGIQIVNPTYSYTYKCDEDINVLIDYCDMIQWY